MQTQVRIYGFSSHLLQDVKAFLTQARPKQALHDNSIYLQNIGKACLPLGLPSLYKYGYTVCAHNNDIIMRITTSA